MEKLLVAAVMVFVPLALMAQNTHFKFNQEGAFGSISANPDPLTSFSLQVSRGTNNGVTATSLTYFQDTFSADFNTLTIKEIFGTIPNSAFTGDNVQGLSLGLDTSTLDPTTSFSELCTLDLSTFTFTCGPLPTGIISLTFKQNGANSTQILTCATEQVTGPVTIRTHQRGSTNSANVNGSILGVAVSSSTGTVGVNTQSQIEVIKN